MNAIVMLERQHRKVQALFEKYEQADAADDKQALFEEIADRLAVHTTIEEKVFYPAAYARATADVLEAALQEHLTVKRLIVDLMDTSPEDPSFDEKMKVMKEQVLHHVQEEEAKLFPDVQTRLDEPNLEQLGLKMQGLFSREMKAGPSRHIAEELDEAPHFT